MKTFAALFAFWFEPKTGQDYAASARDCILESHLHTYYCYDNNYAVQANMPIHAKVSMT